MSTKKCSWKLLPLKSKLQHDRLLLSNIQEIYILYILLLLLSPKTSSVLLLLVNHHSTARIRQTFQTSFLNTGLRICPNSFVLDPICFSCCLLWDQMEIIITDWLIDWWSGTFCLQFKEKEKENLWSNFEPASQPCRSETWIQRYHAVVAGTRTAPVVGTLPLIYHLLKVLMPPSPPSKCDGSDKRRQ